MKKDRVVSEVLGEEITLTPSDLYSKEFRTKMMGGYDKDEVEHFLERVADVFESLIKQNRDLRGRNEELRQEVESYHEMESTLRNALVSSQKFHEDMLEHARREADAMLEEAKLAKALAITKASKLPELLQQEINTLRAHRDALRTELRTFLQSHVEMLEQLTTAEETELTLARESAEQEGEETLTPESETPDDNTVSEAQETVAPSATMSPSPSMKPERSGSTDALTRMLTRPMQMPAAVEDENSAVHESISSSEEALRDEYKSTGDSLDENGPGENPETDEDTSQR